MSTWLIFDANYLAHRAYHAMRGMSHGDSPTGMLFGFLRDVGLLAEQHNAHDWAFCFDAGRGERRAIYAGYKASRDVAYAETDADGQEEIQVFHRQVDLLERKYLPTIGMANIFSQRGYEADDLVAACVDALPGGDRAIIVSADKDLWQLLASDVQQYNPHSGATMTVSSLWEQWRCCPVDWMQAKAIAGCVTDDVPGIKGVGEKTAVKWLRGELRVGLKTHDAIDAGLDVVARNMQLVRLPFPGTKTVTLRPSHTTAAGWRTVLDELGIKTLDTVPTAAPPAGIRKRGGGFGL